MSAPITMLLEVRGTFLYGHIPGGSVVVRLAPFRPETEHVDPILDMLKGFERMARDMPKEMQDLMANLKKGYEMEARQRLTNVALGQGPAPWEESIITLPVALFVKMDLQVGDILKIDIKKKKHEADKKEEIYNVADRADLGTIDGYSYLHKNCGGTVEFTDWGKGFPVCLKCRKALHTDEVSDGIPKA